MATALIDPVIESEDLSESQLLLGEEDKTGHESIIKNDNYKEMKTIKNKEETKGEKQKEKKVGEREGDGNNEDKEEEEQRSDSHNDSGADSRVNEPPLCCHNSTQNSERINRILRTTKRHKTVELSIKTIFIGFVLLGTAILSFNYGKEKAKNETREDKTLKSLYTTDKPSTLMTRIFDEVSRDPRDDDTDDESEDDTEIETVNDTEDNTEIETIKENKEPTGGHDGRDELDEIQFTDQEPENRDDGSTTTTTKKPFIVSFWPR